jgi:ureidoglycolate dehydrogenase (NAD+)
MSQDNEGRINITRYLADLRASQARPNQTVLALGDREWNVEADRRQSGIPIDLQTAEFLGLGGAGV